MGFIWDARAVTSSKRAHCTQRSHNANTDRELAISRAGYFIFYSSSHSHREKIRLHVINHDYIKIISYPRCFEQPVHRSSSRLWCAPGSSHSLQAHRAHIVGTNPSHNHYSTTSHQPVVQGRRFPLPRRPKSPSTLHIRIRAIPTSHLRARRCCRRRSSINLPARLCTRSKALPHVGLVHPSAIAIPPHVRGMCFFFRWVIPSKQPLTHVFVCMCLHYPIPAVFFDALAGLSLTVFEADVQVSHGLLGMHSIHCSAVCCINKTQHWCSWSPRKLDSSWGRPIFFQFCW